MRSKLLLLTILALIVAGLTACGDTPPTGAPPAATSAPATGGSSTSSLPSQPTLPPVAPRQATPFVAATSAPILNVPAPTRAAAATSTAAPTTAAGAATPAAAGPTTAPAGAVPTAPGVATGKYEDLKVDFVQTLGTAEQVDEITPLLKSAFPANAIKGVSGNEVGISIAYDPGLVTPGQIRAKLASLGHPVKN